ncbi:MAG TPA: hypothetical protein VG713_12415 [Pirellulales bacterium]|nr:hypothetical protein [Pirellulales bacterium]
MTATAEWNRLLEAERATGKSSKEAVTAVQKKHPKVHARMLLETNSVLGRPMSARYTGSLT